MADKVAEQKPVESTVEDVVEKVEKVKEDETVVAVEKEEVEAKNGDAKTENGDTKEELEPEEKEKNGSAGDDVDASADKCCIKRKSTAGGEAQDVPPAEGATPEKKAKLDESAEAEVAA